MYKRQCFPNTRSTLPMSVILNFSINLLPPDFLYQLDIATNHKNIVHIECEDDDDPVVVVDVDAYIRLRGTNPIEIRAGSIV